MGTGGGRDDPPDEYRRRTPTDPAFPVDPMVAVLRAEFTGLRHHFDYRFDAVDRQLAEGRLANEALEARVRLLEQRVAASPPGRRMRRRDQLALGAGAGGGVAAIIEIVKALLGGGS